MYRFCYFVHPPCSVALCFHPQSCHACSGRGVQGFIKQTAGLRSLQKLAQLVSSGPHITAKLMRRAWMGRVCVCVCEKPGHLPALTHPGGLIKHITNTLSVGWSEGSGRKTVKGKVDAVETSKAEPKQCDRHSLPCCGLFSFTDAKLETKKWLFLCRLLGSGVSWAC